MLPNAQYVFVVLKDMLEKYNCEPFLKLLAPNCLVYSVSAVTGGAAISAEAGAAAFEKNNAKGGKVLDVPRHEGKVVLKGRGCDHAIGGIERGAFQLALTLQYAPAIGDGVRNGQDAVTKPDQQIGMKPSFQLGTAAGLGKHDESFADFTNRDSAQIECGWGLCFQPGRDARFGPVPAEF